MHINYLLKDLVKELVEILMDMKLEKVIWVELDHSQLTIELMLPQEQIVERVHS